MTKPARPSFRARPRAATRNPQGEDWIPAFENDGTTPGLQNYGNGPLEHFAFTFTPVVNTRPSP